MFEYLNVERAQCREADTSKKKNSHLSNGQRLHTRRNGDGMSSNPSIKHETRRAGRKTSNDPSPILCPYYVCFVFTRPANCLLC